MRVRLAVTLAGVLFGRIPLAIAISRLLRKRRCRLGVRGRVGREGLVSKPKPYGLLGTGRRGYGGGKRGKLYTYRYTVTIRMIPALRWAAMRAILMLQ